MALSLILLALVAQAATPPPVRARADLRALFSASDYPAEAAVNGEQGLVGFTVEVRPDGSVSACRTTRSSGAVSLDEGTCRVMMQARFTPARDAANRPVEDIVASRIRWQLWGM